MVRNVIHPSIHVCMVCMYVCMYVCARQCFVGSLGKSKPGGHKSPSHPPTGQVQQGGGSEDYYGGFLSPCFYHVFCAGNCIG